VNYKKKFPQFIAIIFTTLLLSCIQENPASFNGNNALNYVQKQVEFGPRIPGSSNSNALKSFLEKELEFSGWNVEFQNFIFDDEELTNIIAKSSDNPPRIIIGTHFDTRELSDNESLDSLKKIPVPGANDGASGTAVLLELSRVIKKEDYDIWLLFFDGEDQGYIKDWDWSMGARYFVNHLILKPDSVIIIDMIGDANLNIYKEKSSTNSLVEAIWNQAEKLGYGSHFIQEYKYSIIDDHLPFIENGIPACLIIDFDYPYWHTTNDTPDKISANSLEIIGNVLISWLSEY